MSKYQHQENFNFSKNRSALICGCGRMGGTLAASFSQKGYDVTIVDTDADAFRKLPPSFSGFQVLGDGTDIALLERAGIGETDLVIATADRDNVNSMIGQIANTIYKIKDVFIRLYDPDKKSLLEGTSIRAIFPSKLSIEEFERLSHITIQEDE